MECTHVVDNIGYIHEKSKETKSKKKDDEYKKYQTKPYYFIINKRLLLLNEYDIDNIIYIDVYDMKE